MIKRKPPAFRKKLFDTLIAMADAEAAGNVRHFNKLYESLPAETRAVMALLDYFGAQGDLRQRLRGRKQLKYAAAIEQQGGGSVDTALLRKVGKHLVENSGRRET